MYAVTFKLPIFKCACEVLCLLKTDLSLRLLYYFSFLLFVCSYGYSTFYSVKRYKKTCCLLTILRFENEGARLGKHSKNLGLTRLEKKNFPPASPSRMWTDTPPPSYPTVDVLHYFPKASFSKRDIELYVNAHVS